VSTQTGDEKKYTIKKIEEKEKVSTQNKNKKKKLPIPGLSGSGDPQKEMWACKIMKKKTNTNKSLRWAHNHEMKKKTE